MENGGIISSFVEKSKLKMYASAECQPHEKGEKSGDNEDNGIHVLVTMKHTTHTTTAYIKYINEVLCQHIMSNIPA